MKIAAFLDATSGRLQDDLDETVDLTRALAGKPVWRWAFDALRASTDLISDVYVASSNPRILKEAQSLGAIPLKTENETSSAVLPLLRVDCGATLLTPDALASFLGPASEAGSFVAAGSSITNLPPALIIGTGYQEEEPMEIPLSDRIEAARLLFNDWDMLEAMVRRHGFHPGPLKPIRLLVSDVDGVMTDAGFYFNREGQALKKFSTRDGMGLVMVRDRIELGIITGEASGFAEIRFANLKINRIKTGTLDKLPTLNAWRKELGLEWDEVAYVGDDLPDIPCMRVVGIAACPNDAEPEVKAVAHFVSNRSGGRGAVRDFINHLVALDLVPPEAPGK